MPRPPSSLSLGAWVVPQADGTFSIYKGQYLPLAEIIPNAEALPSAISRVVEEKLRLEAEIENRMLSAAKAARTAKPEEKVSLEELGL